MGWIKQRMAEFIAEPSTWKGAGWLLVAAGILPAASVDVLVSVGLGVVGLVDIIRKEKK